MYSLFEEDDVEMPYRRFGREPVSSGGGVSFTVTSTLAPFSSPPKKTKRKRTKFEALSRVGEPLGTAGSMGRNVPFLRPYAKALQWITVGLILTDPLDRLE